MRTKTFLLGLLSLVAISLILIVFDQQQPKTIQNLVTTTHKQLRSFKDTLRDAETKSFTADEKYLKQLGLQPVGKADSNVSPKSISSSPVIVTYVMEGQESQAIGLINNVARIIPNNTVLVYNLGLGNRGLRTLSNFCNSSHCQIVNFDLSEFPSHVQDDTLKAFRPIIIQDALQNSGAVFFMEASKRFYKNTTSTTFASLFNKVTNDTAIIAWPMDSKNAVSTLTHKKMFDYFRTESDNFIFVPMVSADILLVANVASVRDEIMLPWVQCALTRDCITPIGAQSGGCRFDKKPQYRYSGCHNYDTSALNIILGIKFKLDYNKYTYQGNDTLFETVPLEAALSALLGLEQNATTEDFTKHSY